MRNQMPDTQLTEESYSAGQTVPAGVYENVETHRIIQLTEQDALPASCDGRTAAYVRRLLTWAEIQTASRAGGNDAGSASL